MALVKPTSLAISNTLTRAGNNVVTYYAGPNAPSNPQPGDEWYNTSVGKIYKNISSDFTAVTFREMPIANISGAWPAYYADLAEQYVADGEYDAGTVVVFGGEYEITVTTESHDTRVAGIISTNPAYLMNSETTGLPVALTGRVPCKVIGPVTKGQVLVTGNIPGTAMAIDNSKYLPGCVVGKALEAIDSDSIEVIEVAVGRF